MLSIIIHLDFVLHHALQRVLVFENVTDNDACQDRLTAKRLLRRYRKKNIQAAFVKDCM